MREKYVQLKNVIRYTISYIPAAELEKSVIAAFENPGVRFAWLEPANLYIPGSQL